MILLSFLSLTTAFAGGFNSTVGSERGDAVNLYEHINKPIENKPAVPLYDMSQNWETAKPDVDQKKDGRKILVKKPGTPDPKQEQDKLVDDDQKGTPDSNDKKILKKEDVVDSDTALADCTAAAQRVDTVCQTDEDSSIKDVMRVADPVLLGVQAQATVTGSCSKAAEYAGKANMAVTAWKSACVAAVWSCTSTCKKDALKSVNVKTQLDTCKRGKELAQTVVINAIGMITSMTAGKQCSNDLNNMSQICNLNPMSPGCASANMDCRNPAMASNTVCQCQNPANANSVACQTLASKLNSVNSASTTDGMAGAGGAGDLGAGTVDGMGGPFGDPMPAGSFQPDGGGGGQASGGGGKGVQASTSGSTAGGGNNAAGGSAPSGLNTKISQGFFGGSGGGSFGGGSGSSGGSGSPSGPVATGPNGQKFDLKQFLPGGAQDPRRSPAGVVGPDGITGPAGDLFQKMNIRFADLGPSLTP